MSNVKAGDESPTPAQPPSCYRMESGQDLIQLKQFKRQPFMGHVGTWCFEASWEVTNKQGGIYTVLRSKAAVSTKELGDRYIMLGPLTSAHQHEVELWSPLPHSPLAKSLQVCRDKGWRVEAGRWLVEGNPTVVLFDLCSASGSLNSWKHELYEKAQIGIPHLDKECNDLIILGFMMAQFIADFRWQISQGEEKEAKVVAHFHEWMSGVALIMLRLWKVEVATVFTTHATLLGRHLCAGAMDFYNYLQHFNVDVEAGKRKIYHRYCLERAAAHLAHVFTTVSDITAQEAEYLIKRKPDLITPNGLNVKRKCHEFQNLHQVYKQKILNFVHGHFHGHINFNLDKTLFFFTAGRYEFSNKGGDVFIEALARLNHYLKACASEVTIIAFIIFPTAHSCFNNEALRGHAITKSLQETIGEIKTKIGRQLYENCCRGEILHNGEKLISDDDVVKLKRVVKIFSQRSSWPPITTHNIENDEKDPVIQALKRCNLFNDPADRVKVVFHPEFLSNDNPLLGLSYEEFVRGCHLGVFPSYYEPWGYTPAECTVMGIPSVTTNLSGFGCFIEEHVVQPGSYGIHVVDRKFQSVEESVKSLAQIMFEFSQMSRRQRIIMRNRTERLSDLLDWRKLGIYYSQARYSALHRTFPAEFPVSELESLGQHLYHIARPESSFSSVSRRTREEAELEGDTDLEAEEEEEARHQSTMRGSKSSPVSAQAHVEPQSSVSASSPALRRSDRKRGAVEEVAAAAAAQPLTTPELRRSKRIRMSLQQQTSIFETPPASSKKQGRKKVSASVVAKNREPPATLMSLPHEVLLQLLRYLDVDSLESLASTCSQFDLLIHGRFLTSLAIPFDESFLKELGATETLEKKPLLRLQCTKPRGEGDIGTVQYFMTTFVEAKPGVREYILKSQMALLQLEKVREIDLVPRAISPQEVKSPAMWDSFQDYDRIILRHMSGMDILRNLSRLEIMIVDEDFSQTVLKEFMPKLPNLLEFKVTIIETKASIRTYFYGKLEDIVTASRAPLFTLSVLGTTKKNFPKVFHNQHIKKIVLSCPCTFSLFLIMKNLREVVLKLREAGPSGDCCTYQKKANLDRSRHAPGLCIVHLASTHANCPKLERFAGVELPSQTGLSFSSWNKKLKPLFHRDYVKQGGGEDLKTWTSRRWFSRRPLVPEVWGAHRIPGGCAMM